MKPAYLSDKPVYPRSWQQLPLGERIGQLTEQTVNAKCRQFFGYHMVQLGDLSCQLDLSPCPIQHRILQTHKINNGSGLLSLSEALPYQENSIDAFVLAHELDFASDPHQILREINYAIIPNGHLVISGFNPVSFAGLGRLLPIKRDSVLRQARFFTAGRIKDWLQLLGFEVLSDERMLHSELLFERQARPNSRWQNFSDKYLPLLGSIYVITAKKRESTLTMIKPKWKVGRQFAPVGASVQAWHRDSR
ncbi:class I SAM-dependent methyltransferase [Neptunicella sp. SCSIO 80796]|uniref:class I SAM-dependent methyltransferase n=1 Tax=Neptunicella plasticusilytica TaxID=3117012 RepID=UPI003A4E1D15